MRQTPCIRSAIVPQASRLLHAQLEHVLVNWSHLGKAIKVGTHRRGVRPHERLFN